MKISIFGWHAADLSTHRKWPQGIESTQRMHFWIAFDLIYNRKLVRSQLNSQILSCDHFSGQNTQNLLRAVNRQPGLPPGMTRRAVSSSGLPYEVMRHSRWPNYTLQSSKFNQNLEMFMNRHQKSWFFRQFRTAVSITENQSLALWNKSFLKASWNISRKVEKSCKNRFCRVMSRTFPYIGNRPRE